MKTLLKAIRDVDFIERTGKVSQFFGLIVESTGPDVFLGELCEIHSKVGGRHIFAEVVGLRDEKVLLMPYGELRGISLGSNVVATGHALRVPIGEALLGRIIDAFGEPLDGRPLPDFRVRYPIYAEPLNPLTRPRISSVLETGVKTIDSLLTLGKGQRVGIFSGSGVGKSTLLGMIARNMNADVNVIALVGERGREVRDFVEKILGPEGLERSVVIVATSDQTALARSHAALTATTIAEFFRDQGKDVVLTMDSVTRFAMAQREIGLSIGEPPTSRGYTPSVFAALPKLLERGGTADTGGSITAFYTVLVEGDDMNDPIADSIRSILDGHIVLSREYATRGHYPAIDVLASISRLLPDLANADERRTATRAIEMISAYENSRDLIEVGAYRKGTNLSLDMAIAVKSNIDRFLKQDLDEFVGRSVAMKELGVALTGQAVS